MCPPLLLSLYPSLLISPTSSAASSLIQILSSSNMFLILFSIALSLRAIRIFSPNVSPILLFNFSNSLLAIFSQRRVLDLLVTSVVKLLLTGDLLKLFFGFSSSIFVYCTSQLNILSQNLRGFFSASLQSIFPSAGVITQDFPPPVT